MSTSHLPTPGPWMWHGIAEKCIDLPPRTRYEVFSTGKTIARLCYSSMSGGEPTNAEADARLIAESPTLFGAVERAYEMFGATGNDWPGRHTIEGQRLLSAFRDVIAAVTGREPMDVQDDYCARAALSKAVPQGAAQGDAS